MRFLGSGPACLSYLTSSYCPSCPLTSSSSHSPSISLHSPYSVSDKLFPLGSACFILIFLKVCAYRSFFRTGLCDHHDLQPVPLMDFLIPTLMVLLEFIMGANPLWGLLGVCLLSTVDLKQESGLPWPSLDTQHWVPDLAYSRYSHIQLLRQMKACQLQHQASHTEGPQRRPGAGACSTFTSIWAVCLA